MFIKLYEQDEIKGLKDKITELRELIFELEEQLAYYKQSTDRSRLISLGAKNEKYLKTIEEYKQKNKELREQNKRLNTENARLVAQIHELEQQYTPFWEADELIMQQLREENVQLKEKTSKYKKLGRARRFSDIEKKQILECIRQGKTYREIATAFNCSIGMISKIVKEHKNIL